MILTRCRLASVLQIIVVLAVARNRAAVITDKNSFDLISFIFRLLFMYTGCRFFWNVSGEGSSVWWRVQSQKVLPGGDVAVSDADVVPAPQSASTPPDELAIAIRQIGSLTFLVFIVLGTSDGFKGDSVVEG